MRTRRLYRLELLENGKRTVNKRRGSLDYWAPMSLLLVEDEPRVASFLMKGLSASGYSVMHVTTGQEAIDCVSKSDLSLVVLDLGLPDIDGLEVLDRIRKVGNDVPVIILTARTDPRDRARAMSLGANDYIGKPFSFGDLISRVRVYLSDDGSAPPP